MYVHPTSMCCVAYDLLLGLFVCLFITGSNGGSTAIRIILPPGSRETRSRMREGRGEGIYNNPIYLDWWGSGVPGETTCRTWEEIGRKLPTHICQTRESNPRHRGVFSTTR